MLINISKSQWCFISLQSKQDKVNYINIFIILEIKGWKQLVLFNSEYPFHLQYVIFCKIIFLKPVNKTFYVKKFVSFKSFYSIIIMLFKLYLYIYNLLLIFLSLSVQWGWWSEITTVTSSTHNKVVIFHDGLWLYII